MSRTVRPAVVRTGRGRATDRSPTRNPGVKSQGTPGRGRGRGTPGPRGRGTGGGGGGRGRGMDPGYNQVPETEGGDPSQGGGSGQNANAEGRMQSRGSYTMITPNEKRRQTIQQQAQKEENMYKQHKESQKLGHVSYVGTIGGGQVTEADSRRESQLTERQAAFNRRQKSQQYRADEKRREDEKYGQKKAEQRKKAESNAQRESDRKASLDEDRRQKNAAFLARYDQQNRQKKTAKVLSSSAAVASAAKQSEDEGGGATALEERCYSNETSASSHRRTTTSSEDDESPMETLQREYPYCDEDFLHDILFSANGNLAKARALLS